MDVSLLADENVYRDLVERLCADGFDVKTVGDFGGAGAPDRDVLSLARREGRVLLTFDRDFGDIRYSPRDVPGVVLLRFRHTPIEESAERVCAVLRDLRDDQVARHLVVITPLHVRRRALGA